ncbi:hypothetical protein D186_07045 [Citrobacter freundii ATCC 8090 = MTCC 1658 = NBRC 12681]|nr:hypothetical protein D186_07045 [Citrobacter freundii ATCC 8090 = MTCC 1658 = NBRC 12681]
MNSDGVSCLYFPFNHKFNILFFCMYHRLVDFILFFLRFFIIYPYAYVSDIVFMNMFMLAKTTIKKILFP